MSACRKARSLGRGFLAASVTVALCLAALAVFLDLSHAELRVPFQYEKDALFTQLWVKTLVENGWYLHNDRLGAPSALDLHDFPMSDNLHFLLLRLGALVCEDPALLCNLFFLATFPLAALTSLFVLRSVGMGLGPAVAASVLFAFAPYHFFRGQGHLFLSGYFLVPLAVLVMVWIFSRRPCFFAWDESQEHYTRQVRCQRSFTSLAIAAFLGAGGVYYAYFACCLLGVAGLSASWRRRRWQPLVASGILIVIISLSVLANLTPNLLYHLWHGPNPDAVVRQPGAAEIYGLKIAQLLLPIEQHRLTPFASLRSAYTTSRLPQVSLSEKTPLGVLPGLGFVLLLGRLLASKPRRWPGLLDAFGTLNGGAVLLSLMGGFGALIALGLPWIRCYERIAIYIAFWSTGAVFFALDQASRRSVKPVARWSFPALLAMLLAFGLADQVPPHLLENQASVAEAYRNDGDFVAGIEAVLPPGALVFQLPYMPFPENGPLHRMLDYDHLRGYLHSRNLRWSYGAVKGRTGDAILRSIAQKPMDGFLQSVAFAGFQGIYLDRFGFAELGTQTEAELRRLVDPTPLVSRDQRLVFFNLTSYAEQLRRRFTTAEWQAARERVLHPLTIAWRPGFSIPEGTPENNWRWCGAEGDLEVENPSCQPRHAVLRLTCSTGRAQAATLRITGPELSGRWEVSVRPTRIVQPLTIPPGRHVLHFACDAARVVVPTDGRELVFRVENLAIGPED
jgi:phosphoglycerol transferase